MSKYLISQEIIITVIFDIPFSIRYFKRETSFLVYFSFAIDKAEAQESWK